MPTLRSQSNVTLTQGDQQLVQGNLKRVAIVIGSPKTSPVWLNFTGPAAPGVGIAIRPGQSPLVLTREVFAEALTDEIRACCEAGTENIGVIDLSQ